MKRNKIAEGMYGRYKFTIFYPSSILYLAYICVYVRASAIPFLRMDVDDVCVCVCVHSELATVQVSPRARV